jgi:hypothetical protein
MIVARADDSLLVILEPGNLDLIQIGKPVVIPLSHQVPELPSLKLSIAYTPDIVWIRDRLREGMPLPQAIESSLTRPEVHSRPSHPPEIFERVKA